MNTALLLKVKAAILAEPLKFNMAMYFQSDDRSPCGTTSCIGGSRNSITAGTSRREGTRMIELLPCPFCDHADVELQSEYERAELRHAVCGWANVHCGNCDMHGPTVCVEFHHQTGREELELLAAEKWNNRAGLRTNTETTIAAPATMSADLITAAEAALVQLKEHHAERTGAPNCPTPQYCPTAAAIANLEVEIAKAKRAEAEPEATYGGGVKVEDMDPHDVADAILRAQPRQFMPSAHRICHSCDQILPDSTPEGANLCRRCQP